MESAKEIADSFKIRASATLDIMAESKVKGKISVGAQTYCKKWLKEKLFNRRDELKNKYVGKGNATEEDGFTLMATELNLGMVYKNTERKENEWMTGECDLFLHGNVYDNKASWSLDTFPMFENKIDPKYWNQLQTYGCLWNVKNLNLCYTLNDLDDESVYNAIKWEESQDKRYEIVKRLVYTNESFERLKSLHFYDSKLNTFVEIPDEKRIKHYAFERDDEHVEKIKTRVEQCRPFIYDLLKANGYK